MNGPGFNDWRLVVLSPLPHWILWLLGVGLVLGVGFAAWGVRREPTRWRRYLLWGLRAAAGVAALFFLLEPGLRRLQLASVKNRVAVLVDRSASMGFPVEAGGPTRAAATADFLEKAMPQLERLRERFTLELYGFYPELSPVTAAQLRGEPPRAGRTDLMGALRAISGGDPGGSGKKLSGVLLVSDGADNAELAGGVGDRGRRALEELGVPVSTVLVGDGALRDLAIEGVKVDDFAFVRNAVTVEVSVRARGFSGTTTNAVLTREGAPVGSKEITFRSDDEVQDLSFTFTPDQTGRFVYTLSVPVFQDEAVADNNSRAFTLKTIRDRIRALLVVGRPSWDERFLRGLLKQDANIDLVSFYILRTLSDETQTVNDQRELSLIPFPTDEIFNTRLHTFDVIILQNFGYTEPGLSIAQYERNLEQYVQNGGALLFIGGDRVLGEGRSNLTTLAQALPVEPAGQPANPEPFKPRLTPEGMRHPVTALGAGTQGTEAAWGALPAIPGLNLVVARPGATVLLEHPFTAINGKNAPLLALWDYGRGRVATLATDGSWYWAFTSHASGTPTRSYERFFGNSLRWLVRDPELTTVTLSAEPPSVEPGQPVGAVVTARTPDYQPAVGARVRVELSSVESRAVVGAQEVTTGADGAVRVEFPPPSPGAWKLKAQVRMGEKELGTAEDAVAVRAVGPELADAWVRPALLEEIAEATGGRSFRLPQAGLPDIPLLDPPVVEVGRSRDEPLWDRWYYLAALVALMGAEWVLRRRFGYI